MCPRNSLTPFPLQVFVKWMQWDFLWQPISLLLSSSKLWAASHFSRLLRGKLAFRWIGRVAFSLCILLLICNIPSVNICHVLIYMIVISSTFTLIWLSGQVQHFRPVLSSPAPSSFELFSRPSLCLALFTLLILTCFKVLCQGRFVSHLQEAPKASSFLICETHKKKLWIVCLKLPNFSHTEKAEMCSVPIFTKSIKLRKKNQPEFRPEL